MHPEAGDFGMTDIASLRAQALSKRESADLARRVGPGLSLANDRQLMVELSQELDAEAARLEAQADEIERSNSS